MFAPDAAVIINSHVKYFLPCIARSNLRESVRHQMQSQTCKVAFDSPHQSEIEMSFAGNPVWNGESTLRFPVPERMSQPRRITQLTDNDLQAVVRPFHENK